VTAETERLPARAASSSSLSRLARLARVTLVAALGMTAAGCAADADADDEGDEADAVAHSEDAILGGSVERGWPAVGMLRFATGSFGTGVLVTPTVVLTAAHVAGGRPTQFFYGTAPEGKTPTPENLKVAEVAETVIHPCYDTPKAKGCPDGGKDRIDVALVRLTKPITDVAPVPMVQYPLEMLWGMLSPYEGDSCVAVGFGAFLGPDKKVSLGMRRSAKSTVAEVNATELVTIRGTGIATSGDSGGPLVCGGRVIGVVRGSAGRATPGSPYDRTREGYERIDLWRSWIATQTRAWSLAAKKPRL